MARERIRLSATDAFSRGGSNKAIAKDLRVSLRSVELWRHFWRATEVESVMSAVSRP
ncbi:helix-turn-helix domain-containing protein [Streptomyces sp. NPDC003483]